MDKVGRANRVWTRREFLGTSLGVGAGLFFAGCGGGSQNNQAMQGQGGGASYEGPNVELAFWNGLTGGDGPFMVEMIERFNSEHENITVNFNAVEWDQFYQRIQSAVSVGRGPEVALMQSFYMPTFAARNIVMPLDDVAQELGLEGSDFPEAAWEAGTYEGTRYGIPLDVWPYGMYHNVEVMENVGLDPNNPPQTGDELVSALGQLKEEGIQGWWVEPTYPTINWLFQSLIAQSGGSLFNEDLTEATINSDVNVEALTWLSDIVREGYSPRDVGADTDDVAFNNNNNCFMSIGPWQINYWKEQADVRWGVTKLPRIGSEDATWAGSHNFVIPQQQQPDENKLQASKVFIRWISENSAEWAKAGQVPARANVRESQTFQELEAQNVFADQLPNVHYSPKLPGFDDIDRNALGTALNRALLLTQEPKAALDQANEQANQQLEQIRQEYDL